MTKPARKSFMDIICGINGTGKTTYLRKILAARLKAGERVLILTTHPEEWQSVPLVSEKYPHHISNYVGARRILYYKGCLEHIQEYFSNGILVFDDARTYIRAQATDFMTWLQISRRQRSIDCFCVFHGLTQVPPIFFTFATRLHLFYTADNIKRRAEYVDDKTFEEIESKKVYILWQVESGNPYYNTIIVLDKTVALCRG